MRRQPLRARQGHDRRPQPRQSGFRDALEGLLADFLAMRGQDAGQARCRALAIAINGLLDGLWLEGCLAGELFEESELVRIALSSVEALIGVPIDAPAANEL